MRSRTTKNAAGKGTVLLVAVLLNVALGHESPVARSADFAEAEVLPELGPEATLEDYLAYAALENPGLEAAFYQWKSELEKIVPARTLPEPFFDYGLFIRRVETRVGAQRHRFGVRQMFPWFGKLRLRSDAAADSAEVARQRYEALKLRLFYQVQDAYYEVSYLARAISITEENIGFLRNWEEVARAKYRAGTAEQGIVIKAQVELGKLENQLRTHEELRPALVARLNAALNRPSELPLPWPSPVPRESVVLDDAQLRDWLIETNPQLKGLEAEIDRTTTAIKLARKEYAPDFTLGLSTIDTGPALNPETPGSGKDPLIATLSLRLPIWRKKLRAAEEEARFREIVARKNHEDKINDLSAELAMVLYRVRDARRKIALYSDTLVPLATHSLQTTATSFTAGRADFLDFIDAQRVLLDFQLSYERALADHAQRLAQLEMLVGRELQRESPENQEPEANGAPRNDPEKQE